MENPKVFVSVDARFEKDGGIMPRAIVWENGHVFDIDEIKDVRRAVSLKAGGAGMRYTIRIGRTTTYLFLEENQWFVERRNMCRDIK